MDYSSARPTTQVTSNYAVVLDMCSVEFKFKIVVMASDIQVNVRLLFALLISHCYAAFLDCGSNCFCCFSFLINSYNGFFFS